MLPDQIDLFNEYSILKADPILNRRRIDRIEVILVQMNRSLIYYVARKMPLVLSYMGEVEAVGCASLLKAIRTYDPTLGIFATHAIHQLRSSEGLQGIQKFYASGAMTIPHNAYVQYLKEKRSIKDTDQYSDEAQAVHTAMNNVVSVDAPTTTMTEHSAVTIEQTTFDTPMDDLEALEISTILRNCIEALEQREQDVIALLYGLESDEEMNLRSVGAKLSLSHEMIRKIRNKALIQLKRTIAARI